MLTHPEQQHQPRDDHDGPSYAEQSRHDAGRRCPTPPPPPPPPPPSPAPAAAPALGVGARARRHLPPRPLVWRVAGVGHADGAGGWSRRSPARSLATPDGLVVRPPFSLPP